MIAPRLHSWRDAESLMDSSEIVKHEIQREGMDMVLNFLGMRIRQLSESAHVHTETRHSPHLLQ
jgi:hypothetical protein